MSERESLVLFKGYVATATSEAPDQYPDWHSGWAYHRNELLTHWSAARRLLKRDLDHVATIDAKLAQAIESFDRGKREPGQSLMWEIYNVLNLNTLR
jgi:hypothetical protein